MEGTIQGEYRRQFEETFAALAAENPNITTDGREDCRKALDLVEEVVRGTKSRGIPTYIEADDLIQECLLRLPDAMRKYRGENGASPKTYLRTVIRRDVLDQIAAQRREPINSPYRDTDNIEVGNEVKPEDERAWKKNFKSNVAEYSRSLADAGEWGPQPQPLMDACGALTPEQRAAVTLCDLEGITQEEAAARLGIKRTAIASRLRKAHGKLAKLRIP